MLVIEEVDLFYKSIRVVPRVYPVSIIRGGFLFFTGQACAKEITTKDTKEAHKGHKFYKVKKVIKVAKTAIIS